MRDKKQGDSKSTCSSESGSSVDRFTSKRGKPLHPRLAIIDTLKTWQEFKNAELERDKIEMIFSVFIKKK